LKNNKPRKKSILLGLGLDGDEHTRITKGKNFQMMGGSRNTHDFMVEKAIKFNEELDKRKKPLEEVSKEEFHDIANEIGLTNDNPS